MPAELAGRELDGQRQPAAALDGRLDLADVCGLAGPADAPEQRDRLADWQDVQSQRPGPAQIGQPAPGGDQDQAPARDRQQRAELVMPGRVVQDHHGGPPGQLGPPQGGALTDGLRDLSGRDRQHLQQLVQRFGRVQRRAARVVGVQVEVDRPVRVLVRDRAGRADGQRRLAHAGHALDDGDAGMTTGPLGEQGQLRAAAHELRRLGRQGVRRGLGQTPPRRPDGQPGVPAQDALVQVGQRRPRLRALLLDQAAPGLPVQAQGVGRPPLRHRAVI